MKKLTIITLILSILLTTKQAQAQNSGTVVAGVVGLGLALTAAEAQIKQFKEQMELGATEYLLENRPEFTHFELNILDFNATKVSDLSNVSCVSFALKGPNIIRQNKMILLMFLSSGWMNEFGVDFTKVRFELFDKNQWGDLFFNYISMASSVKITDKMNIPIFKKVTEKEFNSLSPTMRIKTLDSEGYGVYTAITNYKSDISYVSLTRSEIEIKYFTKDNQLESTVYPLIKTMNDDNTYMVADFSAKYKVVYNEKSIGLYIKELKHLVQLSRTSVNAIQSFLLSTAAEKVE